MYYPRDIYIIHEIHILSMSYTYYPRDTYVIHEIHIFPTRYIYLFSRAEIQMYGANSKEELVED